MDLEKIKEVLDLNLTQEFSEDLIMDILAKDEKVLISLMKIMAF